MLLHDHKKSIILSVFFLTLIVFSLPVHPSYAAPANDKNVVLEMGSSRIYTDIISARSAAVSQCLLSAIEKTAIDMIPFTGLTEKFESISDLLSSQRGQFISGYKVLKEIKTENYYRVLVQVTVATSKLKEILSDNNILITPGNLPKILFLITEQLSDDISMQYWWGKEKSFFQSDAAVNSMKKIFVEKGFSVIDDKILPYGLFEDLNLTAALTDDQVIEVGRRVNVDVVISGKAIATEMSNRMGKNIRTFKSTVTAKALLTETGKQIAQATNSKTSVNMDSATGSIQSLAEAGKQAGIELTAQILDQWHARMEKSGEIKLTLKGTDILPYLVLFRNKLKKIDGVNSQHTIEMTPDEAVLSVKYDGTSRDLADALLQKTFGPFGINIYDITENTLFIEIIEK